MIEVVGSVEFVRAVCTVRCEACGNVCVGVRVVLLRVHVVISS